MFTEPPGVLPDAGSDGIECIAAELRSTSDKPTQDQGHAGPTASPEPFVRFTALSAVNCRLRGSPGHRRVTQRTQSVPGALAGVDESLPAPAEPTTLRRPDGPLDNGRSTESGTKLISFGMPSPDRNRSYEEGGSSRHPGHASLSPSS